MHDSFNLALREISENRCFTSPQMPEVFRQRKHKLMDADTGPKQHNVLAELKF